MFSAIIGLVFFGVYALEDDAQVWQIYAGFICIGIFILRLLIEFLRKAFSYTTYKKFPENLGFKLEGWDALGSYPNQLKSRHWSQNTTIEIILSDTASKSNSTYLRDALYLFMANANKKFYEAEVGNGGRKNWEYNNALKIAGSSNRDVIGEMYILINDYLKSIQEKHSSISIVRIKFDQEIFEVEPPMSND